MHAGFLDVLHDCSDERLLSVADRIDVDLDRTFDEPIDEQRSVDRAEVVRRVADPHRPAAEDVRRPHENRVADAFCDLRGLVSG